MSRDAKQAYGKATWNPLALSLLLIKGISLFPPWRTKCVCGAAWTHSIFHAATLCSLSLKTQRWAGASPAQGLSQRSWKPPRGSGNIDREFLSIPRAPRSSQLSHLTCTAATCLLRTVPPLRSAFSKQGLLTIAVISNYGKGRISPKGLIFCHDWIKKGGSCWDWKRSLSHIGWWRNQRSCHPAAARPAKCRSCHHRHLSLEHGRPAGTAAPPSSAGINCLFNKWC